MALFTVSGIRIAGMAACVPLQKLANIDYEWINERERKMFIKTVGISERRVAPPEHTTSDWCFASAQKLIDQLGWQPADIGLIVFVSQSPDYFVPATCMTLHKRLGLPQTTMAFDINLGCSGWVYAMSVVSSLMKSCGINKALVMAGDKSTMSMSYKDKSTYPLFGDGGTATALCLDPNAAPMVFNMQSDGNRHQAIIIPHGATRTPVNETTYQELEYAPGVIRHQRHLALDGMAVFNFSINEVPINIKETAEAAGKQLNDYDFVVLHQANKLMTEQIRRKLSLSVEQVPYSIGEFGNTSSASIPLTIVYKARQAVSTGKPWLLMSGFGVGLSWATLSAQFDHIVCPELIEM
ncbi:MAG: ketoacyl-ACP synthase III [Sphingobacteriales bacterium]|nr:ketoacyl-ACP synthase III [Sphingobacteriales bacterium]